MAIKYTTYATTFLISFFSVFSRRSEIRIGPVVRLTNNLSTSFLVTLTIINARQIMMIICKAEDNNNLHSSGPVI